MFLRQRCGAAQLHHRGGLQVVFMSSGKQCSFYEPENPQLWLCSSP